MSAKIVDSSESNLPTIRHPLHPKWKVARNARLSPGMCAGFKAGSGNGHRLVNETLEVVVYLEVGDRSPED